MFRILIMVILGFSILPAADCAFPLQLSKIEVKGVVHTHPEVVQREISFQAGESVTASQWQETQEKLEALDLFAQVKIDCEPKTDSSQNATILLKELFQIFPSPALKQSDQDGWMAGGAIAALNLLGWDIRAELQARFTVYPFARAKEFAFYGSSPYLIQIPLNWKLDAVKVDSWDALRNYQEKSIYTWFESDYRLGKISWVSLLGFRNIQHETNEKPWLSHSSSDQIPTIGGGIKFVQGNFESEFQLLKNGGYWGNSEDNREYLVDLHYAHKINQELLQTGILTRVHVGDVGFYNQYFHGGANTLRGYQPDSSVRGNSEILSNLEWAHIFQKRTPFQAFGQNAYYALHGVVGLDGSVLWNGDLPNSTDYRGSIYAGIHLVIPALEKIRIEFGFNPWEHQWAITVGLFEKWKTQRWRSR